MFVTSIIVLLHIFKTKYYFGFWFGHRIWSQNSTLEELVRKLTPLCDKTLP